MSNTEYIERGALIRSLDDHKSKVNWDILETHTNALITLVIQEPAADVAPVARGEWIWKPPYMICSICGRHSINRYRSKYCQHCGAKMAKKGEKP